MADRSKLNPDNNSEDVPSHGRSFDGREKWTSGVRAGLTEAEAGAFVSEEEIDAVLDKYAKS
ncbi:transcriptional regulator [Agrobacterium sp. ICMP 6402]|uniref:transcriptional regulator n=1 Tax=Agrobacterium sp. ICMP 6402 TaxID=2292443 RepID=UPI0018860070|nr:transcriptional regulator [Agrobacterium sp. ICMP 6402]